jgi:hypothetical protein
VSISDAEIEKMKDKIKHEASNNGKKRSFMSELIAVRMFNLNTGKEQNLEPKPRSSNFFFKSIYYEYNGKTYEICPRLDFPKDDLTEELSLCWM